jgi:pimeloyl-ACP methyl ester carboxylesterase
MRLNSITVVPSRSVMRLYTRRVLVIIALMFAVGIGGLLLAGQIARRIVAAGITAPGQLVNVGGHKLHLFCQGAANRDRPTLVLEAGMGESSLTWAGIQPALARTHRVCAYDRAGYGWSDPSTRTPSAAATVDELHTLLQVAGEPAPYVLVGHSLGGIYARLFAQRYSDEVAGLVLLDPSHEEMVSRLPADWQAHVEAAEASAANEMRVPIMLADLGLIALFPQLAVVDPRLPGDAQASLRALNRASSQHLRALVQDLAANASILDEVQAAKLSNFGELPLIVIKAGAAPANDVPEGLSPFTPTYDLFSELAGQSSAGRLITLPDSTHYVHYDKPHQVLEAIISLLDQIEAK